MPTPLELCAALITTSQLGKNPQESYPTTRKGFQSDQAADTDEAARDA